MVAAQGDGVNGGVPGLDGIRDEMERNPRNPFAGNVPATLAELEGAWGDRFRIAYEDGWWTAKPKAGGEPLKVLSPDDLIRAMSGAR